MTQKAIDVLKGWSQRAHDDSLPPLVALVGDSDTYLRKAMDALLAEVFRTGDRNLNTQRFDGSATRPAAWLTAARTAPMLARKRVVEVTQADAWFKPDASRDEGVDALVEFARSKTRRGIVVLVARKVDMRSRLVKCLQELRAFFDLSAFEESGDVYEFIQDFFRKRGAGIESAAAAALADAAGASADALVIEMNKLLEFARDSKTITRTDVEEMVTRTRGHQFYELSAAVSQRNTVLALTVLDRIYRSLYVSDRKVSEPGLALILLASLERDLRMMAIARSLDRDPPALAARLGLKPYVAKIIAGNARRFTPEELAAGLTCLRDADKRLKSTRLPHKLIMEDLIVSLCGPTPPAPHGR